MKSFLFSFFSFPNNPPAHRSHRGLLTATFLDVLRLSDFWAFSPPVPQNPGYSLILTVFKLLSFYFFLFYSLWFFPRPYYISCIFFLSPPLPIYTAKSSKNCDSILKHTQSLFIFLVVPLDAYSCLFFPPTSGRHGPLPPPQCPLTPQKPRFRFSFFSPGYSKDATRGFAHRNTNTPFLILSWGRADFPFSTPVRRGNSPPNIFGPPPPLPSLFFAPASISDGLRSPSPPTHTPPPLGTKSLKEFHSSRFPLVE